MTTEKNMEQRLHNLADAIGFDDSAVENVMSRIETETIEKPENKPFARRLIMNRLTKLTAAAVIIIAAVLFVNVWDSSTPSASAAEVLADAAEAVSRLTSVYIKARMRTIAHDNFALIGLDYDFVPIEMWKEFDGTAHGKYRFEKPKRTVVMNGKSTFLFIKPNRAAEGKGDIGSVGWLKPLLDLDKVLDSEIKLAQQENVELLLTHEKDSYGDDKLVVIVYAQAHGDFTNDWCKNSSIVESDHQRIYRFDAETKLLESLQVFVYSDDGNEVMVFETIEISYNVNIAPALFTIELPHDIIWYKQPQVLDEKYQQMSPKEVAQAFFEACANEDWDEFLKFKPATDIDQRQKEYIGRLEIISIGEPFKSGLYPGWFVPYEIKFRDGHIKKMNLAIRNDNPAKRYVVDGGF